MRALWVFYDLTCKTPDRAGGSPLTRSGGLCASQGLLALRNLIVRSTGGVRRPGVRSPEARGAGVRPSGAAGRHSGLRPCGVRSCGRKQQSGVRCWLPRARFSAPERPESRTNRPFVRASAPKAANSGLISAPTGSTQHDEQQKTRRDAGKPQKTRWLLSRSRSGGISSSHWPNLPLKQGRRSSR